MARTVQCSAREAQRAALVGPPPSSGAVGWRGAHGRHSFAGAIPPPSLRLPDSVSFHPRRLVSWPRIAPPPGRTRGRAFGGSMFRSPAVRCLASFTLIALGFGLAGNAAAAERALWLRYPAISPDGRVVVFGYRGNLWKVPATGGAATALTLGDDYNTRPVWSPDGSRIAFASDRNGNFDVFVMPAEGGEAKRLTFHSANDIPYDFTPNNKFVLFGTNRNDIYTSARFPQRSVFSKLYQVPINGGRSVM